MISKEIIHFLGLTRNEIKVLDLFGSSVGSLQVADISQITKIPRMTVYLVLESLKKRGLAEYTRKGKRRFWHHVEHRVLTSKVLQALTTLTGSSEIGITANNTGFTIYYGVEGLYKSWESLKDLLPNTRVYGIQPAASIKLSVKKINWERIKPLQETILKKPIIFDGVLTEDYYPTYMELFAHDKKLQRTSLESFLGRATDMSFVDPKYFANSETELLILPSVAYLTDWRNEVSIEIKNPIMLLFLRQLYELAKGYGRKYDQNAYIKGILDRINKK